MTLFSVNLNPSTIRRLVPIWNHTMVYFNFFLSLRIRLLQIYFLNTSKNIQSDLLLCTIIVLKYLIHF